MKRLQKSEKVNVSRENESDSTTRLKNYVMHVGNRVEMGEGGNR